jgi:hypothetical protein
MFQNTGPTLSETEKFTSSQIKTGEKHDEELVIYRTLCISLKV